MLTIFKQMRSAPLQYEDRTLAGLFNNETYKLMEVIMLLH